MDGRNTRERIPNEKNEAIFLMAFKYLPFATSNSIVKDKQEILFIFFEIPAKDVTISDFHKADGYAKTFFHGDNKIIFMLTQSIFHGGARTFFCSRHV